MTTPTPNTFSVECGARTLAEGLATLQEAVVIADAAVIAGRASYGQILETWDPTDNDFGGRSRGIRHKPFPMATACVWVGATF